MKLSDEEIENLCVAVYSMGERHMSGTLQNTAKAIRQLKEERGMYMSALKEVSRCMSYNSAVIIAKQALGEDDANRKVAD